MTSKPKKETVKKSRKAKISQESDASDADYHESNQTDDAPVEVVEKPRKGTKSDKPEYKREKTDKQAKDGSEIKYKENDSEYGENSDAHCDEEQTAKPESPCKTPPQRNDSNEQFEQKDGVQRSERYPTDREPRTRRNFTRSADDPRRMPPREAGRGFGMLYDDRALPRRRNYDDPRSMKRFRDDRSGWRDDRGFDRPRDGFKDLRDGPRDSFRDFRDGPRDGFRDRPRELRDYPRNGYRDSRDDFRDFRDGPRDSFRDSRDVWRGSRDLPRDTRYSLRDPRDYPRTLSPRFDRPYDRPRKIRVENPDPTHVLGLFGTPIDVRTEDVSEFLQTNHPEVSPENIVVVQNRYTGRGKGFVFVYYKSIPDATAAKEKLIGKQLMNRDIRVDFSISAGRRETRLENE